jgi:hypothetical protein
MKKLLKYDRPRRGCLTLHSFQARIYLIFLLAVFQNSSARVADAPFEGGHDREWSVYSGGPESIRYSKLTQINRDNDCGIRAAKEAGEALNRSREGR